MKMEQTECSETSAYKIQTPGNYPEENIQHVYNTSLIIYNHEQINPITASHIIFFRFILISSLHLRLRVPILLFLCKFSEQILF